MAVSHHARSQKNRDHNQAFSFHAFSFQAEKTLYQKAGNPPI
nr:MAG TPA: hypothetical protein [Caudoviricetes sp.]